MNQPPADRRWAILALLGVAQLMVVLDATIVNVALPSAQRALDFSTDERQWIVTAYALSFGSLLLLGGKLGDLFGRKRTFVAGLLGFAAASALGGFAQSFGALVGARALQGAFGALLAPSALALLTVTFAGTPDRAKAFGIFSGIAAAGGSFGLLLGGALTEALSWRWCLYVNLVIAVPATIAAVRLIPDVRSRDRPHIDLPGLLTGSFGLFALVFGLSQAETSSWGDPITVASLAAGAGLLIAFVAIERRVSRPLVPPGVVRDRGRAGALSSIGLSFAAMFSVFLFLTFFLQRDLGFSPLDTGLAMLPLTLSILLTAGIVQTRLLARTGARPLVATGMTLGIAALLALSRLTPASAYASDVLPALIVLGIAVGAIFAPSLATATLGVEPGYAGVASALVNTAQQVGGSIGIALLSTLFAGATRAYATTHPGNPEAAAVHGYATGFTFAAALLLVGLVIAVAVIPARSRSRCPRARREAAALI